MVDVRECVVSPGSILGYIRAFFFDFFFNCLKDNGRAVPILGWRNGMIERNVKRFKKKSTYQRVPGHNEGFGGG